MKLNKVVKIMVFSDLFLYSGWGLVSPILAVFIINSIQGGSVKVAGIAVGVYWLGKAIMQIPIAHYLDLNHGERDDYYALIFGTFLAALTPIGFIFAYLPWHVYVLQFTHALAMSLALPSWDAIFTRHIQQKREAFCWSVDKSIISFGAGISGIIGGALAEYYGFIPLFISIAVLGLISTFVMIFIGKEILPKVPRRGVMPGLKP